MDGINTSSNYLSKLSSILPSELMLSCPIDFPYGLSDSKIRQHQIISAIKNGANCVDLVVNPVYLLNDKRANLVLDIKAQQNICNDRGVRLRLMLEYRHFDEFIREDMLSICNTLKVGYIFPSTGHFVDDYLDNLIVASNIESSYKRISVITNGNIWNTKQYQEAVKAGIYGIQLKFSEQLKEIIG